MKRPQYIGLWLAAVCSAAYSACAEEARPATALVVSVKSQLANLASVEVAVFEGDADPSRDAPGDDQTTTVSADPNEPVAIVIAHGEADEVLLAVRGLDQRGQPLAENRLRARFVPGKSLAVHVLLGGSCAGVFCDDQPKQTCHAEPSGNVETGKCGPIQLVRNLKELRDPEELHNWDASGVRLDAGGDGGLPNWDAGEAGEAGEAGPGPDHATCDKPPLANATCGLSPSCGCPAGQACHLTGLETTSCGAYSATASPPTIACTSHGDCGAGYSCVGSRCAKYCQEDADCGEGGVCLEINDDGEPVLGAHACLLPCTQSTSVPCGQGTVCARSSNLPLGGRTLNGTYCVAPLDDCPFTNDGKCDEPEGTRWCTEGSDAADCLGLINLCSPAFIGDGECDEPEGTDLCPEGADAQDCSLSSCNPAPSNPPGGPCDLVRQCGCAPGQTCQHTSQSGGTAAIACRAVGPAARDNVCNSSSDCALGTTCRFGVCRKYCTTAADCGSGYACNGLSSGGTLVQGVRTCLKTCAPSGANTCGSGQVCTNDAAETTQICVKPANPCPYENDEVCDDPTGTRYCAAGTDPDCS